jgi:hypothetical protein
LHARNCFDLFSEDDNRAGVIIGTGPGLTKDQLSKVSHLKKFGCNNAIFATPLDVFHACNIGWYDHYWPQIKDISCDKWTWSRETADKYGINHIEGRWADGLSTDPGYIHLHHGAGPQLVNLAYHYGCRKMILIGWDMRYHGKNNRYNYEKRHFFGEYPAELQHWPQTGPDGELTGLIKEMETIKPADYGIEIINCTPGSAMKCFPEKSLDEVLDTVMTDKL